MKRHNFILKDYKKVLWERERNKYRFILLILFTVNFITFSLLSYKKDQLDSVRSKAIFNIEEDKVTKKKGNYTYIFEVRERFEKYLGEAIKLKSFFYEEEKIKVEVLGKEESNCIEIIKDLEEKEEFYILGLSSIESTEEGYKVSFDIAAKESWQSK